MATGKFNPENFGDTTLEQVSNFRYTESEKKILNYAFSLDDGEFSDEDYFELAYHFAKNNGLNDNPDDEDGDEDDPEDAPEKRYKIRVYVFDECSFDECIIYVLSQTDGLDVVRGFSGKNGVCTIYDVECDTEALKTLIQANVKYFPLNHYEDFVLTCPCCGERIDDSMILNVYDENLLSGYNILCARDDCGCQMANVGYLPE